jgi:hypothetical protein
MFAQSPSTNLVIKEVRAVQRSSNAGKQIAAAEKLRNTAYQVDEAELDDRTIHTVASLLAVNNDGVRYRVADALGRFGTRARFAGPKLLEILKRQDYVIVETTSIFMIRRTPKGIGTPPPPRKCDRYSIPN